MLAQVLKKWLFQRVTGWLVQDHEPRSAISLCDFERLRFEIRPGDVLLVEGRSRVSDVIKIITQSPWTHSALYIGRLHDLEVPALRERLLRFYEGDLNDQIVIEALLDQGTVVKSLHKYDGEHVRICRPKGLSRTDAQHVITYAIDKLGTGYDVRHLLDLARLMFPYAILPRRWRSTLFQHNAGDPTRTLCSCMLAEAFNAVDFPIMPFIQKRTDGTVRFYKRNTKLFTPRDFDSSPYFDIIKYPYLGFDDLAAYRKLPWDQEGLICNDECDCYLPAGAGNAAAPSARRRFSWRLGARGAAAPASDWDGEGEQIDLLNRVAPPRGKV